MAPPGVFAKLNLKDHTDIVVVNAPQSFEPELARLDGVRVRRKVSGPVSFALAFVTRQAEVDALAAALGKSTEGDAIVWFAYPKGSSKRYTCEFNRDSGWKSVGDAGFEPVRMVAIDEDWSALRFRKTEFIKTMKRGVEHRISAAGRARAKQSAAPSARRRR